MKTLCMLLCLLASSLAIAADQPWEDGKVTTVAKISIPAGTPLIETRGFEYTITTAHIGYIAVELFRYYKMPPQRFHAGDTVHLRRKGHTFSQPAGLEFIDQQGKKHLLRITKESDVSN